MEGTTHFYFCSQCSTIGTHTTASSQRDYIKKSRFQLLYKEETTPVHFTSLADVEIVTKSSTGAPLFVAEVRIYTYIIVRLALLSDVEHKHLIPDQHRVCQDHNQFCTVRSMMLHIML